MTTRRRRGDGRLMRRVVPARRSFSPVRLGPSALRTLFRWGFRTVGLPGVLALGLVAGCDRGDAAPAVAAGAGGLATVSGPLEPIPDSTFGRLVAELSEPGGYFDTDNLISNESSYLQVMGELEARSIRGGVYLGVGPGQNFSYVAAIRPALVFLVDIRRDNLLQHLWFKALFERSVTRLDYLCLMVGRACGGPSDGLDVTTLVGRVAVAAEVDSLDAVLDAVVAHAATAGVALTAADRRTIRSIHARFAAEGLGLRFNSHGRAPRPDYPTLERLLLERDREGRAASYLTDETHYRYLRALQEANRVVPVVGDLAGDHALRAIGREIERRDRRVTAVYTSNVEFYLFGDRTFPRWVANLETLPISDDAVIIRSYFNRFRPIAETVPGYSSTQLLQPIPALLAAWEEGRVPSYRSLIAR